MKQPTNLRERYIQLVETFIAAIESGRSGSELEDIRNEIRMLSAQLNDSTHVENHTQPFEFMPLNSEQKQNETDTTIS
jgi:hypothetical protein